MRYLGINSATEIFSCAAEFSIKLAAVRHEKFFEFSTALKKFEHRLGELARDPVWKPFVMTIRRYRFDVSAAPLPFNYRGSEFTETTIKGLGHTLTVCKQVNPDLAEYGHELLTMLSELAQTTDNPILTKLKELCDLAPVDNGAVLIKEPRLIQKITTMLEEESPLPPLRVISIGQLQGEQCFQNLFIIGPARWYPDYIFMAPRGKQIHVLKYAWLIEDWKPTVAFLSGSEKSNITSMTKKLVKALSDATVSGPSQLLNLDPAEILPRIDWDALKHRIGKGDLEKPDSDTEELEYVDSRVFLLEGDIAVALDSDESAKALVIDPGQVDGSPIRRIPVLSIERGMFILVRIQGGGEYIAQVADTLMGEYAAGAREMQRQWKSLLRRAVIDSSITQIVSQLRQIGGKRPNEINVRNWMSYRTIKPQDRSDFQAIMRLVGLGDKSDRYWETAGMIDSAHRRAGHRIAQLLLKEVRGLNIGQLTSVGRMDFTLPGVAAGALSAIRVQGFHEETMSVPVHRLGRLVEVGDING